MKSPKNLNESEMNWIDRLGLAFCRLNAWEWDEICGEKPNGFDDMPDGDPRRGSLFHRPILCKRDFVDPLIALIEDIGRANTSRCWWMFNIGRTEEEWLNWYLSHKVEDVKQRTRKFRRKTRVKEKK